MNEPVKNYSVQMSSIGLTSSDGINSKIYPLMEISIHGTPSLADIIHLMNEIKVATRGIVGDYISATDLSNLSINKFLSKIILKGMESTYKSLLSVGKQSVMSFVLLGEMQEYASFLGDTLKNVNEQKIDTKKDYKYRYYFVKSKSEIKAIAEQILM